MQQEVPFLVIKREEHSHSLVIASLAVLFLLLLLLIAT